MATPDVPESAVEPASSTLSAAGIANSLPNQTSEQLLRGRWVRPDGGYVIELAHVQPDGRLEVSYFNPRPINVSRAEGGHRSDDGLQVFVELRQANYPGAICRLPINWRAITFSHCTNRRFACSSSARSP